MTVFNLFMIHLCLGAIFVFVCIFSYQTGVKISQTKNWYLAITPLVLFFVLYFFGSRVSRWANEEFVQEKLTEVSVPAKALLEKAEERIKNVKAYSDDELREKLKQDAKERVLEEKKLVEEKFQHELEAFKSFRKGEQE